MLVKTRLRSLNTSANATARCESQNTEKTECGKGDKKDREPNKNMNIRKKVQQRKTSKNPKKRTAKSGKVSKSKNPKKKKKKSMLKKSA